MGYYSNIAPILFAQTGAPGVFDIYSGGSGFALFKLRSAQVNCIEVWRNDVPHTSAIIGFSGGQLDTVALLAFASPSYNCYIRRWYNQDGSGIDAYQATDSDCQLIVSAGALISINGFPCIDTESGGFGKPIPLTGGTITFQTAFTLAKVDTTNTVNYLVFKESVTQSGIHYGGNVIPAINLGMYDGTNSAFIATAPDTNQHVGFFNCRSGNGYIGIDGAAEVNGGTLNSSLTIDEVNGRGAVTTLYFKGKVKALLFWNSDQSGNRTAIEAYLNAVA